MTKRTRWVVIVCQILGLVFLAWQMGCAKDDGGGDDDDVADDDDTSGDVTITDMIDDLESGDGVVPETNGRKGFWWTYNDETEGGEQTPGDDCQPEMGGVEGSDYAMHTYGSGFSEWGAGIGFDINTGEGETEKGVFDASGYTGVAFYAKGSHAIRAMVKIFDVINQEEGGGCTAGEECENGHGLELELTEEWTQYQLPFDEIAQESGWGLLMDFDSTTVAQILFHVNADINFDYWIDNVGFY